ncbi:MAG TPA: methyl-accepting chemotaxis protein [Dongiaceae bacterium]|nr:methyl-accepting chemotaxis protein [Dongiaceae bacterium]
MFAKLKKTRANAFRSMVDDMPVNVMTCRLGDFVIDYVNRSTVETLTKIEHVLPVKAANLVGTSIDVFHRNPQHQRQILSDAGRLPFKARISIGGEILDLLVTPIMDGPRYVQPMLTWSLVTEKVRLETEQGRLKQVLDELPISIITCDLDFKINYINRSSVRTLSSLQQYLPVPADKLIGQSIDVFHKNPQHQRRLLGDPGNLPHRAKIRLGPETLDLQVSATMDADGRYSGPLLSWSVVTATAKLAEGVSSVAGTVSAAADGLQATAQILAQASERVSAQSAAVAAATEQLTSSVNEISRQTAQAAAVTQEAVKSAGTADGLVGTLNASAAKIGDVVKLIADIAGQTNLLALNATIEAARAGEAGKGFAVVASEVKSLATQTGKATDEISGQVGAIQSAIGSVVAAIQDVTKTIGTINEVTTAISAAVEEQNSATQEVARNIQEVNQAAGESQENSAKVLSAAADLTRNADSLSSQLKEFLT